MEQNQNIDGIEQTQAAAPVQFAEGLRAVPVKFNFKSRKLVGADGEPILGEDHKPVMSKQPSLEAFLPVPTAEALAAILVSPDVLVTETGEVPNKTKALILDLILDGIKAQAKSQLDEAIESFGSDASARVGVQHLDYDKLTLEYIASIEPARRAGAPAITEEEWKEFGTDYVQIMQAVTGKPLDKLQNAVDVYLKPNKVRAKKELLPMFIEQLSIYIGQTKRADDFALCVDVLVRKFTKFLQEQDKLVADAF